MSNTLIRKGLKDGTKSRNRCLTNTRRVTCAPLDGDIEGTIELFQTKYRAPIGHDKDDDDDNSRASSPACILPTGWGKRLKKPGKVYQYSKLEIMEYNEMQYLHGPEAAKAWADRRLHARDYY